MMAAMWAPPGRWGVGQHLVGQGVGGDPRVVRRGDAEVRQPPGQANLLAQRGDRVNRGRERVRDGSATIARAPTIRIDSSPGKSTPQASLSSAENGDSSRIRQHRQSPRQPRLPRLARSDGQVKTELVAAPGLFPRFGMASPGLDPGPASRARPGCPGCLPVIPAGARHPGGRPLQLTVAGDRTTIMTTVT